MSAPPSYDEVAGPSSGYNAAPPAHNPSQQHHYPSAAEEKAQAQQAMQASTLDTGEKRLKIWHAASGNSLVTAADEKTPIYNVIDSRAPDEAEQRQRSQQVQQKWEAQQKGHGGGGGGGMSRQDPSSTGVPDDVRFAHEIAQSRQAPLHSQPQPTRSALWTLEVRRGGSRQSEPIATIKRHINTKSAVSITLHGQKTGIEQHSGIPHTKYEFHWAGKKYIWTRTRKAPGTSALDSGNFVCRDEKKTVYAWSTDEDSRCDGSLIFENRAIDEQLLDVMMVTGFVMRDLEDERNNPSYMRYGSGAGYGYGPYASPYAMNYGFYPTPLFFPLLL